MQNDQPGSVIAPGSGKDQTTWQYQPDTAGQPTAPPAPNTQSDTGSVSWTASEFIEHQKTAGWYAGLVFGSLILAGVVYLITSGDRVSTATVVVVAAIFGVFAARKPRELQYSIDDSGIRIGEKTYPYAGFRSFSIVQEEGIESIRFMPLKRFMPVISIYFAPEDGQKIVDALSKFLPVEHKQLDPVDKLMHRLRF